MDISVIIITKDEQPRLRLALIALGRQTVEWGRNAEIVLVDDGSEIAVGPADIPPKGPQPTIIRHEVSRGRSKSRNVGAANARGRRLLFLDGDVLLSPEAVQFHARLDDNELGRGEQRHLRGTRFFRDPRTGDPWPGKEARVRSMGNLAPYLVTEEMVETAPYEKLLERSELAIYPGAAARKLYDLEMGALRAQSIPNAQWIAASGHNFSIPRESFQAAGGFDTAIVSLHLTHREGYRNPLTGEDGWEQAFARRHPFETQIMMRLWRTLADDATLDPAERVTTLEYADELLAASARTARAGLQA